MSYDQEVLIKNLEDLENLGLDVQLYKTNNYVVRYQNDVIAEFWCGDWHSVQTNRAPRILKDVVDYSKRKIREVKRAENLQEHAKRLNERVLKEYAEKYGYNFEGRVFVIEKGKIVHREYYTLRTYLCDNVEVELVHRPSSITIDFNLCGGVTEEQAQKIVKILKEG
jgi:hypothetical protein